MYSVTVHFTNGTHLTEIVNEFREELTHITFLESDGSYTVVPLANVLYYDVTRDDDDSEFGDDAAVYLAPRR